MDMPLSFQRRALTWVRNPLFYLLMALFFLAVFARLLPGPRTIDDSYITFRYARNILAGNGFSYNPGEHVLGTTTPLYTILLTSLGYVSGGSQAPFAQIALLINAIADGFTCLIIFTLGKRFGASAAGFGAALVWAIAPFSVTFAVGGLETSVYILLLMAVSLTYQDRHYILAAFLAALAYLTRPDALILIGPLAIDRIWQIYSTQHQRKKVNPYHRSDHLDERMILTEILAIALPILIWTTFSSIYFGSPIPHSIAAKSLAYRLPANAALVRLLQHYGTPFLEQLTFGIWWIGVGLVLYPFLFLAGALRAWRVNRHSWPFLAYPWLYFAAFAIANPLIFRWYLTPPLPIWFLFILTGGEEIIVKIQASVRMKFTNNVVQGSSFLRNSLLILLVAILPLSLSLRGWTLHPDHGLDRPAPQMAWYQLELLYNQAASSLLPDISGKSPAPTIAAGDVGVLGFITNAHILDTVGLNSPQSVEYYPLAASYYTINYAIPPDLIQNLKPDYVVMLEVYGREGLLKDARFQSSYRLRQEIPTDIYGSRGMLIFERIMP